MRTGQIGARPFAERGAVLVISLIILLMLTLIGVSGARNVLLQEKMSFASRDAQLALQIAEATSREAERAIEVLTDTSGFVASGDKGLYSQGDAPSDLYDEDTWATTNSVPHSLKMDGKDFSGRYFVEVAGTATDNSDAADVDVSAGGAAPLEDAVTVFKIVARGEGLGGTERFLITYYGKIL